MVKNGKRLKGQEEDVPLHLVDYNKVNLKSKGPNEI